MAREVGDFLRAMVDDLKIGYSGWSIEVFDASLDYEIRDEALFIVANAIDAQAGEARGVEETLVADVLVTLAVNWRYISSETLGLLHPADIAASLWAWGHQRTVTGAASVLRPRRWYFLDPGSGDTTRARYLVQYDVEIAVTAAIDLELPSPPLAAPLDPTGDLTPPLTRVTAVEDGDSRVLYPKP